MIKIGTKLIRKAAYNLALGSKILNKDEPWYRCVVIDINTHLFTVKIIEDFHNIYPPGEEFIFNKADLTTCFFPIKDNKILLFRCK